MGALRIGGPEPRRPLCWGTEIESLWAHSQLIGGDIPVPVGWWCCTCCACRCWGAACLVLGVLSLVKCLLCETAAAAPLRGVGGTDRTWVAWGQTAVNWLGTSPDWGGSLSSLWSCFLCSDGITVVCDGLFVWIFSVHYLVLYTPVWSPKAGSPSLMMEVWVSTPCPQFGLSVLFWHSAWSVCTSPAILQALVSVWIPFGVCPAALVWDTWAQESWAERCGQPWAGKKHLWGDESCELLMCFNRQVKYWLLLCWAYGGSGIFPGLWWFPFPSFSLWMIFVQPGVLIFFLGINHLWWFLGWCVSPMLYINEWVTRGISTNVVMLYVMYIRRECILFIFFLIKMYMLARVLI